MAYLLGKGVEGASNTVMKVGECFMYWIGK